MGYGMFTIHSYQTVGKVRYLEGRWVIPDQTHPCYSYTFKCSRARPKYSRVTTRYKNVLILCSRLTSPVRRREQSIGPPPRLLSPPSLSSLRQNPWVPGGEGVCMCVYCIDAMYPRACLVGYTITLVDLKRVIKATKRVGRV